MSSASRMMIFGRRAGSAPARGSSAAVRSTAANADRMKRCICEGLLLGLTAHGPAAAACADLLEERGQFLHPGGLVGRKILGLAEVGREMVQLPGGGGALAGF